MYLYHGTSSRYLKNIQKRGLRVRGDRKGAWDVQSGSDRVYLTNAYSFYFAQNAVGLSNRYDPIIVEVDTERLNHSNMVADEDFLEQATRGSDGRDQSMEERTYYYRDNAHAIAMTNPNAGWKTSLDYLGTCAHIGDIPLHAITRIIKISRTKIAPLIMMGLDPTITLMNYSIVGNKYRWMTAKLAMREPEPSDAPRKWPQEMIESDPMMTPENAFEYPMEIPEEIMNGIRIIYEG